MPINKETKTLLCRKILQILDDKIDAITLAIESARESRNNDTKSSAGDKYETGRAMMQIEIEKNESQLNKTIYQRKKLSEIDLSKNYSTAKQGSMVETNRETYFISIGLGKIILNEKNYYAISLASPIGQAIKEKKCNDEFQFQGREYIIQNIA